MAGQEMIETTIEKVQYDQERGWYRIHTSNGRFDTKRKDLAEEAAALIDAPTVRLFFTTGQPSGNINRHTGQPFPPPRYYESADRVTERNGGGSGIETIGATVQQQLAAVPRDEVRREWRICLISGAKLAVNTLPLLPHEQRSWENQKAIASAWAKLFYFTPPPVEDSVGHTPPTPQQTYDERPLPDEDRWAGVGVQPSNDDVPY